MKRIKSNADTYKYWVVSLEAAKVRHLCVVIQLPSGNYKAVNSETPDIRKAHWFSAYALAHTEGDAYITCVEDDVAAEEMSLERHEPHFECEPVKLEHVLDATALAILDAFPGHDLIKGTLLAKLGELPPAEALASKDELQRWLLENYEKPVDIAPAAPTPARRAPMPTPVLTVDIEASETEYGTASYSVRRSGSTSKSWTSGELQDLLQEAIEDDMDFDGLMERLEERSLESAQDGGMDMDDYGNYEYSDHDSTSSDDYEDSITNGRSVRQALETWVRENATAAQLETLGL